MRLAVVLIVWSALVMSGLLLAQNSGLVTGSVFTPYEFSEAVMPEVRIVFSAGGVEREVTTNQQGRYEIRLPEGLYEISGTRPGFCPIDRPHFPITANDETVINLRLIVCSIAHGAEVDNDGQVIREKSWLVSPLQSETRRINSVDDSAQEIRFEFATRTTRGQETEYRGTIVERNNIAATAAYSTLTIYADLIVLHEQSLHLRAAGHVTVEDGRARRSATVAMINLGPPTWLVR